MKKITLNNVSIVFKGILLLALLTLISFQSTAQTSYVDVSVTWPSWSSENRVEVYDPSNNLISTIDNGFSGCCNDSYSTTTSLGCIPDGNNYYIIMYDTYGDGWNGAANVTINSAGSTVLTNSGASATAAGVTLYFNVSGGCSGTCTSTVSAFPYNEGFETGLGLWTQGTGDNFDWTRNQNGTPSGNTGPNAANGGNYYMYTEATSNFNNTSNLVGPCFDLTSATTAQFSFYYHMFGADMGTLNVELSTNSGLSYPVNLWSQSGQVQTNNGDFWNLVNVDLTSYVGQTIQIRFSGITGPGYRSDMAIDDISVTAVTSPQAEIDIQGNAVSIASGDTTPSLTDDTDFGSINVASGFNANTFTILNNGTLNLNLTDASPYVTISGANAADFTITSIPTTPILAGNNTTFEITFDPSANGLRTATVSIANDDSNENPYTFSIQGSGTTPISGSNNTTIYYENFDANDGGWLSSTPGGKNGSWVYDTGTTLVAEAGYWRINPFNNYPNNCETYLTSPSAISTLGFTNVTIHFDIRFDTDADVDDGMQIQYTTDASGTTGWTRLGNNGDGTNWYNDTDVDGIANNEHGWTGLNYENAQSASKFLEAYVPNAILNNQSTLWFRVLFASDGSNSDDGVAIDNVIVKGDYITPPGDPIAGPAHVNSDLKLWLKADQGTSTSTDNASLSFWSDQAYNNDAVAYGTYQPLFKDNGTDNLNYNPTVLFEEVNNHHMKGKGGYHSQDYYIVLKPNDPVDNTGNYRQQAVSGKYATDGFSVDGTGVGLGYISGRYTDAVIAHTISSYPNSGPPNTTSYGRCYASNSNTVDEGIMILNIKTNNSDTSSDIFLNGVKIDNQTGVAGNGADLNFNEFDNLVYYLGVGRFTMNGYNPAINSYFDGKISEIISYSSKRLAVDQQKIQSYLALKYGATLLSSTNSIGNNETDIDYLDSDGNVIWNYAANAGYNFDVAGIGRDDKSALYQKQSKSINNTGVVSISLNNTELTNNLNIQTFATDQEFLIWGNNGQSMTSSATSISVSLGPATITTVTDVVNRSWKIIESAGHDIGKVEVSILESDLAGLPPLAGNDSYVMLIADDDSFTTNLKTVFLDPTTFNGIPTREGTHDFDGTKYFTIGIAHESVQSRHLGFDGIDNFTLVGDKLDLGGAFTASSWVKPEGPNALNSDKTIVAKNDGTVGYKFYLTNSNYIGFAVGNTAAATITSNTAIPDNIWHHVAVTYEGGTANIYIDGVLDNSKALASPTPNGSEFAIGAIYIDKANIQDFFKGDIDEIRVWDEALTLDQLHYVMNQELVRSGTVVNGSVVPNTITKNEIAAVDWTNLKAYYSMNSYIGTHLNDVSGNGNRGSLTDPDKFTLEYQSSPLPYRSSGSGNWDSNAIWINGAEQYIPGSPSIVDPNITVDWNIVETSHDITLDNSTLPAASNSTRSVLGLEVSSNELTVAGDNGLEVTHYLKVDGLIDLVGESQLIQTQGSDLDVTSSGSLERDQQGTSDIYTYNYWSSPVSLINTTSNNTNFTLPDLFRDGTNPASPNSITFLTSGYNGTNTNPIGLADYWIWKFANQPDDDYSSWQHVRSTGTINSGEGFTLKGPGTGSISTPQNYVFIGKPNNGTITVPITAGHDYLVGNPYPSAIDAHEFLDDNPLTGGTLYFWEHWGGGSHSLSDYQGGYAIYNYSGGIGAASYGTNDPDVGTGGTPTKLPGQYIPVSQGFFVYSATTGTVNFENDQRVFVKEGVTSTFVRSSSENSNQPENFYEDERMKFRIGFNSSNGIHRQLLLTIDENATANVDWGYDGEMNEEQIDDMFWMLENKKYVIQGLNQVDTETVVPLGIHVRDNGMNYITIDRLENIPDDVELYAYDNALNIYHNLKISDYEVYLTSGEYLDRFSIMFTNPAALGVDDVIPEYGFKTFYNNDDQTIVIHNPNLIEINKVELFNILGQSIYFSNDTVSENYSEIKVSDLSSGTYIININTEGGKISKKVLIK